MTLKMQDQKMEDQIAGLERQDWNTWDRMTGLENAGLENVGPYNRAGKCRTKRLNSADVVVA